MRLHKTYHKTNHYDYYHYIIITIVIYTLGSVAKHRQKSGLCCARVCRNADLKKQSLHYRLYNLDSQQTAKLTKLLDQPSRYLCSMVFTKLIKIIISKLSPHYQISWLLYFYLVFLARLERYQNTFNSRESCPEMRERKKCNNPFFSLIFRK